MGADSQKPRAKIFAVGEIPVQVVRKQIKKPTAFEITDLLIKAIVAAAALINAIKWW